MTNMRTTYMTSVLLLACLIQHSACAVWLPSSNTLPPVRGGRMFYNRFTQLCGRSPTDPHGVCLGYPLCTAGGGSMDLGDAPCPGFGGICCKYMLGCGSVLGAPVGYWKSSNYPDYSNVTGLCGLAVNPRPDTCYIRLEFEELHLTATRAGACDANTLTIYGGEEGGTSSPFCGSLTKYQTLIKVSNIVNANGDKVPELLQFAMSIKDAIHRYIIKITQIKCSQVTQFSTERVYSRLTRNKKTSQNIVQKDPHVPKVIVKKHEKTKPVPYYYPDAIEPEVQQYNDFSDDKGNRLFAKRIFPSKPEVKSKVNLIKPRLPSHEFSQSAINNTTIQPSSETNQVELSTDSDEDSSGNDALKDLFYGNRLFAGRFIRRKYNSNFMKQHLKLLRKNFAHSLLEAETDKQSHNESESINNRDSDIFAIDLNSKLDESEKIENKTSTLQPRIGMNNNKYLSYTYYDGIELASNMSEFGDYSLFYDNLSNNDEENVSEYKIVDDVNENNKEFYGFEENNADKYSDIFTDFPKPNSNLNKVLSQSTLVNYDSDNYVYESINYLNNDILPKDYDYYSYNSQPYYDEDGNLPLEKETFTSNRPPKSYDLDINPLDENSLKILSEFANIKQNQASNPDRTGNLMRSVEARDDTDLIDKPMVSQLFTILQSNKLGYNSSGIQTNSNAMLQLLFSDRAKLQESSKNKQTNPLKHFSSSHPMHSLYTKASSVKIFKVKKPDNKFHPYTVNDFISDLGDGSQSILSPIYTGIEHIPVEVNGKLNAEKIDDTADKYSEKEVLSTLIDMLIDEKLEKPNSHNHYTTEMPIKVLDNMLGNTHQRGNSISSSPNNEPLAENVNLSENNDRVPTYEVDHKIVLTEKNSHINSININYRNSHLAASTVTEKNVVDSVLMKPDTDHLAKTGTVNHPSRSNPRNGLAATVHFNNYVTAHITQKPMEHGDFDPHGFESRNNNNLENICAESTGRRFSESSRRLPVLANQAPYYGTVMVQSSEDGQIFLCSSSLIHPQFVLTAASCILRRGYSEHGYSIRVYFNSSSFPPAPRTWEALWTRDNGGHAVVRTVFHPMHDPGNFDFDIAVLELQTPVQDRDPIALSQKNELHEKLPAVVIGHGFGGRPFQGLTASYFSDEAHYYTATSLSNEDCNNKYREAKASFSSYENQIVKDHMICVDSFNSDLHVCEGDEGGPIVAGFDSNPILIGLVSGNVNNCIGQPRRSMTERQYPDIGVRMSSVLEFIDAATSTISYDVGGTESSLTYAILGNLGR